MKTRLVLAGKTVISGLLLVLAANASVAGVDPQVLVQSAATATHVTQPGLLESVRGWVDSLSATVSTSPAFRWIETPPVADDPRLQQQVGRETDDGKRLAQVLPTSPVERVVAPGGMFRRVESAPTTARVHPAQPPAPVETQTVLLSVPVPAGLRLSDADIIWQIRPLQGGGERRLSGRSLPLSLPTGRYDINLLVGAYSEQATVDVTAGQQVAPRFAARFGRLRVSSRVEADWQVRTPDGHTVLERRGNDELNEIVAAGDYDVVANLSSASQVQRVRVASGEVSVASIHLPTGKVSLVATLGNAVAMRPMRWTLYRLDGGRQEIASPQRHSAILVVSPGHYEAVANLDGRERRREFTVVSGSNNHVVLAMD